VRELVENTGPVGEPGDRLEDYLVRQGNRKARTEPKNYFIEQLLARVRAVARIARVIAVGVAHHVTQRGNGRRYLLESETDREVYLDLLRESLATHKLCWLATV
jgi:hypothetical protein